MDMRERPLPEEIAQAEEPQEEKKAKGEPTKRLLSSHHFEESAAYAEAKAAGASARELKEIRDREMRAAPPLEKLARETALAEGVPAEELEGRNMALFTVKDFIDEVQRAQHWRRAIREMTAPEERAVAAQRFNSHQEQINWYIDTFGGERLTAPFGSNSISPMTLFGSGPGTGKLLTSSSSAAVLLSGLTSGTEFSFSAQTGSELKNKDKVRVVTTKSFVIF